MKSEHLADGLGDLWRAPSCRRIGGRRNAVPSGRAARWLGPAFSVLLVAGTLQGCASARSDSSTPPEPAGAAPSPTATDEPAPAPTRPSAEKIAELEAIYEARFQGTLTGYHEADVHFMTGMIGHHAQALVMSGFAPENGASHSIRILCARIINAQQDEINVMQAWLRDRGLEVPEVHIEDGRLMVHGPEHAMHMPGMLTAEQLEELRHARGPDYDRLFLKYMIQHHEGAVTMVDQLFATDGAALGDFVFKLASDIQADQNSEVKRMELMLEAMTSGGSSG